jgi:hypothetical protein
MSYICSGNELVEGWAIVGSGTAADRPLAGKSVRWWIGLRATSRGAAMRPCGCNDCGSFGLSVSLVSGLPEDSPGRRVWLAVGGWLVRVW